jgi:hypothetical protein
MPLVAALTCLPAGTSYATMSHAPNPSVLRQCGVVRTGDAPISGAEVTLFQAGRGAGAAPRVLAHVRSGSHGEFAFTYRRPRDHRRGGPEMGHRQRQ